jgi:hypothetical protein
VIATAAAGAPVMAGTAMLQATGVSKSACLLGSHSRLMRIGPVTSIQSVGWDALAGYTFARVAQNYGTFKL